MPRDSEKTIWDPIITKLADMENSGWRKLADAIVEQTANDYRKLLRKMAKRPYNLDLKNDQTSIEQFFRSDWFGILCDLDGSECIRKLQNPTRRMEGVQ